MFLQYLGPIGPLKTKESVWHFGPLERRRCTVFRGVITRCWALSWPRLAVEPCMQGLPKAHVEGSHRWPRVLRAGASAGAHADVSSRGGLLLASNLMWIGFGEERKPAVEQGIDGER